MKTNKKDLKRFIIRKYIMASSAQDAVRKDRVWKVDEVFIDDQWIKDNKDFGYKGK